ncbi:MAG: DUF3375 domain-containing protein, partial [Treponema sp.]|nr:DUF3375 domain-containing protein [Treponema sp.]
GFLERRFPPGAAEEEYELSTAAIQAIRFVSGMEQPHSAATESRLTTVIKALVDLAEDTDTDMPRRIKHLLSEREQIDNEIEAIQKGSMHVISDATALERVREIISLADDLTGDFHRVRDQFYQLNRDLREQLMANKGSRSEVLGPLFTNMNQISEGQAGRTFTAFWRLLTDPYESEILGKAIDDIIERGFINQLEIKERRFLVNMTRTLLEQGGAVHEVMETFARSLNAFVQSKEYLEQHRINELIRKAEQAALKIKDEVKVTGILQYTLELTSCIIKSFSQFVLYDPSLRAMPEGIHSGDTPSVDLESVGELVAQSEIDFRSLKADILDELKTRTQVSIGDVLERHPAAQGLGSVIGLIALGSRHGIKADSRELVSWVGGDTVKRSAHIPKIFFVRERIDELE